MKTQNGHFHPSLPCITNFHFLCDSGFFQQPRSLLVSRGSIYHVHLATEYYFRHLCLSQQPILSQIKYPVKQSLPRHPVIWRSVLFLVPHCFKFCCHKKLHSLQVLGVSYEARKSHVSALFASCQILCRDRIHLQKYQQNVSEDGFPHFDQHQV